jgi:DnaB-like helicase N terminal domain
LTDVPRADEAEDAVVGAVILAPDTLPAVRQVVTLEDFCRTEAREVFGVILNLADQGQPIDVLTVAEAYSAEHRANGHEKLVVADLAQGCPVPGNARKYAERVRDTACRRRGVERAAEVMRAFQSGTPPEQVAEYAALAFGELASGRGRDAASWYVTGDALRAEPPPAPPGVALTVTESGVRIMRPGLLHSLVGAAGIGKSLVGQGAGVETADAGGVAVFLDAEGTLPTFIRRLHALSVGPREVGLAKDPALADRIFYRVLDGGDLGPPLPEGTALVVLDGLASALAREGLDENSASDFLGFIARVLDPLRRQAPEAAFLLIDHPGHADPGRGRGSSAKRPVFDIEWNMRPISDDRAALVVRKDRHAVLGVPVGRTVAEVRRYADDGGVSLELREPEQSTDDEGNFRPTVLMGRVEDYLARQSNGVSMADIERNVPGKSDGKRAAVAALVREQRAREDRGPWGARVLRLVREPAHDPTTSPPTEGRGHARDGDDLG